MVRQYSNITLFYILDARLAFATYHVMQALFTDQYLADPEIQNMVNSGIH